MKPRELIRTTPTPEILISEDAVVVNGVVWSESRVGAALLNWTRYCRCGECDSCCVGRAFRGRPRKTVF